MRKEVRMSLNIGSIGNQQGSYGYTSSYEKERIEEAKERMGIKDPIKEAIEKQRAPKSDRDKVEEKEKTENRSLLNNKEDKNRINKNGRTDKSDKTDKTDKTSSLKKTDKHGHVKGDPNYECETCKNRKYQDGSDEMVSFKTAQHISPTEAGARVRAHEQEHVSNAYSKAAEKGGKVLQASVAIHTAICPECGRTYVSGGLTTTRIKYNNQNPYDRARKLQDSTKVGGKHFQVMT